MKKSGLADSPFFAPPPLPEEPQAVAPPPQPVYERSTVQVNERSNERMNEPTIDRSHDQRSEPVKKTRSRSYRRYSYDIFDDQAEAIDALAFQWQIEQGRHVTKGEVVRSLLDDALKPHR